MSKASAETFSKLLDLINAGKCIQIEKRFYGYEVTIWDDKSQLNHHHYQGETLIKSIMKIK